VSKTLLWVIAAAIVVILLLVWRADTRPARVTIINQGAAALRDVRIGDVEIGELRGGESRVVAVHGTSFALTYTHRGTARSWSGSATPGQSIVLYVTPEGRVRRATPSISRSSSRRQMSAST
jgi:hypothetical protein